MDRDSDLVGSWSLSSFQVEKGDGTVTYPFGHDVYGLLVYTDTGLMSVQIARGDRMMFAGGDQMQGTPAEVESSFKGCIAYCGTYEVDTVESAVLHHVESSLFPNWEGAVQKRFYELSGDQLRLSSPPTHWGGKITAVLAWQRRK